jgi:hypothetical protein
LACPVGSTSAGATICSFAPTDIMDVEHINAIGSLLADLSARTQQLRGYL